MISEKRQIENYGRVANEPYTWLSSAQDLLTACDFLLPHNAIVNHDWGTVGGPPPPSETIRISGVIGMLRAMAIGCLLKGIWVKSGEKIAEDGEFKRIPGSRQHDLVQLADVVDARFSLGLSPKDRELLGRLSLYNSSGRYPIPSHWQHHSIRNLPQGGKGTPTYWVIPADERLFSELIKRLNFILEGS